MFLPKGLRLLLLEHVKSVLYVIMNFHDGKASVADNNILGALQKQNTVSYCSINLDTKG